MAAVNWCWISTESGCWNAWELAAGPAPGLPCCPVHRELAVLHMYRTSYVSHIEGRRQFGNGAPRYPYLRELGVMPSACPETVDRCA